jgi:hypothetical protein
MYIHINKSVNQLLIFFELMLVKLFINQEASYNFDANL